MARARLPWPAALLALALAAAPVSAADYGLAISNDSSYAQDSATSLTQVNRAKAWGSGPLGSNADLYVSGFYEFKGSSGGDNPEFVPLRLDVDRVELQGSANGVLGPASVLRYSIGRANFLDFSSKVISGLSDGARLELALGNLSIQAQGGYRGLLYKGDALSFVNASDYALYGKDSIYFAPRRAFAGLGLRFIEFIDAHDFGLQAWSQFDLSGSSGATHTQYIEPFIEGRFGRNLRWRAWTVSEFGYDGNLFAAMAAGEQVRLSFPSLASLHITQSVAWASGASGPFRAFTPIRQSTIGPVSVFYFTDVLTLTLDFDVAPFQGSSVGASSTAILRASGNSPSWGGSMSADATGSLLGIETVAHGSASISSDASLYASFGVFIPNTATLYSADTPSRWAASISLNFSI
jgi:hypothetical protein